MYLDRFVKALFGGLLVIFGWHLLTAVLGHTILTPTTAPFGTAIIVLGGVIVWALIEKSKRQLGGDYWRKVARTKRIRRGLGPFR